MSQRLREEVLFMVVLVAVVVAALITAADYPFRARLMPQIVSGAILVLLVVELALTLRRQRRAAATPVEETGASLLGDKGKRALPYMAWLLGLYATIALLGLLPAAALFTLAFSRGVGRMSWGAALLGAMILTGAVFGLGEAFYLDWPQGYLVARYA